MPQDLIDARFFADEKVLETIKEINEEFRKIGMESPFENMDLTNVKELHDTMQNIDAIVENIKNSGGGSSLIQDLTNDLTNLKKAFDELQWKYEDAIQEILFSEKELDEYGNTIGHTLAEGIFNGLEEELNAYAGSDILEQTIFKSVDGILSDYGIDVDDIISESIGGSSKSTTSLREVAWRTIYSQLLETIGAGEGDESLEHFQENDFGDFSFLYNPINGQGLLIQIDVLKECFEALSELDPNIKNPFEGWDKTEDVGLFSKNVDILLGLFEDFGNDHLETLLKSRKDAINEGTDKYLDEDDLKYIDNALKALKYVNSALKKSFEVSYFDEDGRITPPGSVKEMLNRENGAGGTASFITKVAFDDELFEIFAKNSLDKYNKAWLDEAEGAEEIIHRRIVLLFYHVAGYWVQNIEELISNRGLRRPLEDKHPKPVGAEPLAGEDYIPPTDDEKRNNVPIYGGHLKYDPNNPRDPTFNPKHNEGIWIDESLLNERTNEIKEKIDNKGEEEEKPQKKSNSIDCCKSILEALGTIHLEIVNLGGKIGETLKFPVRGGGSNNVDALDVLNRGRNSNANNGSANKRYNHNYYGWRIKELEELMGSDDEDIREWAERGLKRAKPMMREGFNKKDLNSDLVYAQFGDIDVSELSFSELEGLGKKLISLKKSFEHFKELGSSEVIDSQIDALSELGKSFEDMREGSMTPSKVEDARRELKKVLNSTNPEYEKYLSLKKKLEGLEEEYKSNPFGLKVSEDGLSTESLASAINRTRKELDNVTRNLADTFENTDRVLRGFDRDVAKYVRDKGSLLDELKVDLDNAKSDAERVEIREKISKLENDFSKPINNAIEAEINRLNELKGETISDDELKLLELKILAYETLLKPEGENPAQRMINEYLDAIEGYRRAVGEKTEYTRGNATKENYFKKGMAEIKSTLDDESIDIVIPHSVFDKIQNDIKKFQEELNHTMDDSIKIRIQRQIDNLEALSKELEPYLEKEERPILDEDELRRLIDLREELIEKIGSPIEFGKIKNIGEIREQLYEIDAIIKEYFPNDKRTINLSFTNPSAKVKNIFDAIDKGIIKISKQAQYILQKIRDGKELTDKQAETIEKALNNAIKKLPENLAIDFTTVDFDGGDEDKVPDWLKDKSNNDAKVSVFGKEFSVAQEDLMALNLTSDELGSENFKRTFEGVLQYNEGLKGAKLTLLEILDIVRQTIALESMGGGNPFTDSSSDMGSLSESVESKIEFFKRTGEAMEEMGNSIDKVGDKTRRFGSDFSRFTRKIGESTRQLQGLQSAFTKFFSIVGTGNVMNDMITASSIRQTNQIMLASRRGTEEAHKLYDSIQQLVVELPGNDTFLTNLLTMLGTMDASLNESDLKYMGGVIADYYMGAQAKGQYNNETERELRNYLMTGQTRNLTNSIIASEVESLKGLNSVKERTMALEKALQKTGMDSIAHYDSYTNTVEEFKGRFQKSFADLGDLFLGFLQALMKIYNFVDSITGSFLSQITIVLGVLAMGAITATMFLGQLADSLGDLIDMYNRGHNFLFNPKDLSEYEVALRKIILSLGVRIGLISEETYAELVNAGAKAVNASATTAETVAEGTNAGAKAVNASATTAETDAEIVNIGAKIMSTFENIKLTISTSLLMWSKFKEMEITSLETIAEAGNTQQKIIARLAIHKQTVARWLNIISTWVEEGTLWENTVATISNTLAKIKNAMAHAYDTVAKWADAIATNALAVATWLLNGALTVLEFLLTPIGLAILGIVVALYAFYKAIMAVGNHFGWWEDFGSMIDAISAGIHRIWDAFVGSEQVQNAIYIINGFIDNVKALFGSGSIFGGLFEMIFGAEGSGDWDIVGDIINVLGKIGGFLWWLSPLDEILNVIRAIGAYIGWVLRQWNKFVDSPTFQTLIDDFKAIWGLVADVWNELKPVFEEIWNSIAEMFGGGSAFGKVGEEGNEMYDMFVSIGEFIHKYIIPVLKVVIPGSIKLILGLVLVVFKIIQVILTIIYQGYQLAKSIIGVIVQIGKVIWGAVGGVLGVINYVINGIVDKVKWIVDKVLWVAKKLHMYNDELSENDNKPTNIANQQGGYNYQNREQYKLILKELDKNPAISTVLKARGLTDGYSYNNTQSTIINNNFSEGSVQPDARNMTKKEITQMFTSAFGYNQARGTKGIIR